MIKLSDKQNAFAKDVNILFTYLVERNIKFTIGECWRRLETQKILKEKGYSMVTKGGHQDKLAIDIFFWLNGKFLNNTWINRDQLIPIGSFWKNLNPLNKWGGDWTLETKAGTKPDINHFERRRE